MLIRGAHILAIKEQLGHSFVETTMVYLHAAPIAMQAPVPVLRAELSVVPRASA